MKFRNIFKYAVTLILLCVNVLISSDQLRPKIGLVLSGGGAKGLAHIGVLKLIDSLAIPINYIAGTSMGGIIGALYAVGYSGEEIEHIVRNTEWDALFTDQAARESLPYLQKKGVGRYQISLGLEGFTPVIPSGLISGQKIFMLFARLTYAYSTIRNFNNLPIPFNCVTADLVTGQEVVLSSGSLPKAMRATMSIPNIFSPVEWGDSLLIDGGIINNFPVDIVRKMGAEVVIGINVGAPLKSKEELKDILDVFEQTFFLAGEKRVEENKKNTELLISPQLSDYTGADFTTDDILDIMKRGEQAANEMRLHLIALKESYSLKKDKVTKTKIPKRIIHSFDIVGNESLSFSFIYNYLNIRPGQILDLKRLEERITDLFGLGYFNSINYDLQDRASNTVSVTVNVKEKPMKQLRLGFRYDDFHQLVGAICICGTDVLIPGLRFENELQFAGLTRFNVLLYLHSRGLNFPVYPLFRFYFKDDPVNIYDLQGPKIASYKDRSATFMAGFGITPHRFFNASLVFASEFMNIKPDIALFDPVQFPRFKDRLYQIRLHAELDILDDVLLSREGIRIRATYENSMKKLNSEIDYSRFELDAEMYMTVGRRHTFMAGAVHVTTYQNLPIYKAFYLGGPDSFIGLDYDQLITDHANIIRFFYRYEYKKDIFLKILYNAAFDYRASNIRPPADYILSGYGISIKFVSIIGPLELMYARSEISPYQPGDKQNNVYVTAGYKF
jgi:NTE family protein